MKIRVNGKEKNIELKNEKALLSSTLEFLGYKRNTIVVEVNDLIINSKIIGVSANNSTDITNAIKNGCDYIGIGPVFQTLTKKSKKPLGLEKIKALTKDIKIPCFAIGGINKLNISSLKINGISKFAVISGLLNAENPKEEASIILKELSYENQS